MAAPMIGAINAFNPAKEDWSSYNKRLEIWMLANKVEDRDVVNTFLATIGAEAFELIVSLVSPTEVTDISYAVLTQELQNYYKPSRNEIGERFTFSKRNQEDGESVSDYILALKRLSKHCNFERTLAERLRDRFVPGLKKEGMQRRLLTEKTLTWESACQIALSMEMAEKDTQSLKSKPTNGQVNRVQNRHDRQPSRHSKQNCFRCNGPHDAEKCFHKTKTCHLCSKVGHLARACKSKSSESSTRSNQENARGEKKGYRQQKNKKKARAYQVDETGSDNEDDEVLCAVYATTSTPERGEFRTNVLIDGIDEEFIIDTAASVSIIGETVYQEKLSHLPLKNTTVRLSSYSGDRIAVLGQIEVEASYEGQLRRLQLVVAKGNKASLLGRDWMKQLKLNWQKIFTVVNKAPKMTVDEILDQHPSVFNGQGLMRDFKADIKLKPGSSPRFFKARPVPYALRDKVERELNRLVEEGILKKIDKSDWAAPIVVVPKADKTNIRICGDYKVTVNQCLEENIYPLPTAEDLFSKLAGAKVFTKLDLTNAYQQVELTADSKPLLVINTHKGLYEYQRLSFGVSTAPALFQSIMDQILQGLDGVESLLDDILIGTATEEEHKVMLEEVLRRLDHYGVKVKLSKCRFMTTSVEYLGHRIDGEGVHPLKSKTEAIAKAPQPTNVTELRAFLGMVNYYGKFLPRMSTTLAPLYNLLKADTEWKWTAQTDAAFKECKSLLSSDRVLVHYDMKREITLACDASSYGIGCVISHIMDDGSERPIAYGSRTLTASEKNYAQIEKEALSIIFGVKKFHKYLYGRKFTLITDHKPLTTLFGPKTGVPTLAATRLQRWSLILMAHDYDIQYRKSADHSNADGLSRLPWEDSTFATEAAVNYFSQVEDLPVSAKEIAEATRKDPILSRVWEYTAQGWPNHVTDEEVKPYFCRRTELSVDQGCVLWGIRVIVPPKLRSKVLEELHSQHQGMVKMKSIARSYLWYPKLDQEIEEMVKRCDICQTFQNDPPVSPLHPWSYPGRVWERLHIDFAEYHGDRYFIVIDSRSKWIEAVEMNSTTSTKTIAALRKLFATHGLPETIVSDNGPQFTAQEFKDFLQMNGIRHSLSPPYHPASNGAAERAVQLIKSALKKHRLAKEEGKVSTSVTQMLTRFLLAYRTTPHAVTGLSPAELLMGRKLRTRLTLLKPNLDSKVQQEQLKQKQAHDKSQTVRELEINQPCRVRNTREGREEKWIAGRVMKRLGPLRYLVQVGNQTRYVHIDHLRSALTSSPEESRQNNQPGEALYKPEPCRNPGTLLPVIPAPVQEENPVPMATTPDPVEQTTPNRQPVQRRQNTDSRSTAATSERRYPVRERHAVKKLNL